MYTILNKIHLGEDQDSIRSSNRSKLLRLLFEKGSIPRNQIAEHIGLTSASVTRIVSECMSAGLIIEEKDTLTTGQTGRRPIPIALTPSFYHVIGVHIGTFWIDVGLMNLRGEMIDRSRYDRPQGTSEEILYFVKEKVNEIITKSSQAVLCIGVTLNAQVDRQAGKVISHNVLGWKNVDLGPWMEQHFQLPCIIDNNIYAMALAEYTREPLPPDRALLLLNIGSTIGMGMVINNVLIRGKQGLTGFLEHLPWFPEGPECDCGMKGCLTSVLSDRSLLNRARKIRPNLRISNIHELNAFQQNDKLLQELVYQRAEFTGKFLASLVSLYDPARVIVGGLEQVDQFEIVKKSYEASLIHFSSNYAKVEKPKIQKDVPLTLRGACTTALHAVFSPSLELSTEFNKQNYKRLEKIARLPLNLI